LSLIGLAAGLSFWFSIDTLTEIIVHESNSSSRQMNTLSSSLSDAERERLFARCLSFEGAEAIYVEKPGIFRVRMSRISCDMSGAKATAVDLLTHGMQGPPQCPFEISASWEIFSFFHWVLAGTLRSLAVVF
jgi:hypothetical protein